MNLVESTPRESIIFEDSRVLVALAYEPHTKGHCVVIWKNEETDINKLSTESYEYLMDVIHVTRDALRTFYKVDKVYLMYLDESNWVHWHLIPRYEEKGLTILVHNPTRIFTFEDTDELSNIFNKLHQKMIVEN